MSYSLKQMWKENSVGVIIVLLLVAWAASYFMSYVSGKGSSGSEYMSKQTNSAYQNPPNSRPVSNNGPRPSDPLGHNEVFSAVNGITTPSRGLPTSCSKPNIQNPSDLLPRDSNNQWAQLNPSGKGDLANVNLLKAGYHIGIDTIGQSLRNANLQIRSEPPNPQLNVGPWNMSTITSDFLRAPLEIGAGGLQ